MTVADPNHLAALEAYLDGRLSGSDLAEFESRLAQDATLRADVELQERIDGVLRRRFAPPAVLEIPALRDGGGPAPARRSGPWAGRPLAAAAALLLLVGLSWAALTVYRVRSDPVVGVYRREVAMGLQPRWVCDTDEALTAYLEGQYGRALVVDRSVPEVQLVGWTSCSVLSPYTAVLMTRVAGVPVLVLVDQAASDNRPGPPPMFSGLHMFRREVGGMVLYEVSPREEPALLDLFAEPPRKG